MRGRNWSIQPRLPDIAPLVRATCFNRKYIDFHIHKSRFGIGHKYLEPSGNLISYSTLSYVELRERPLEFLWEPLFDVGPFKFRTINVVFIALGLIGWMWGYPTSPLFFDGMKSVLSDSRPPASEYTTAKWDFENGYANIIELRFFSKERNVVWPDADHVWVLNDRLNRSMAIRCKKGEQICYGAWVQGNTNFTWGVGVDGNGGCSKCCFICGYRPTGTRLVAR